MPFSFENDAILFLNDAHGIYIPQLFAEQVIRETVSGVTDEDWQILEDGPDNEWYWEAWNNVETSARITHPTTKVVYSVYQNGDCFLVPEGCEIPEW